MPLFCCVLRGPVLQRSLHALRRTLLEDQGMEVKRLPLLMVSLTFLLIALKVLRALALKLGGSDCWICGAMIVLA